MFSELLKNNFRSLYRERKNWISIILPLLCSLLTIMTVVIMHTMSGLTADIASEGDEVTAVLMEMTELSYLSSTNTFVSLLSTYAVLYFIIMYCNLIVKEIKSQRWVLPINAGIPTKSLFLSKLIANVVWVIAGLVLGCTLNFVFTITVCESKGYEIKTILTQYGLIALYLIMMVDIIISCNFIFKKAWPGVVVALLGMLLLPDVLGMIKLGEASLLEYTPFAFYSYALGGTLTTVQFLISLAFWFGVVIGLPVIAINTNTIKATKEAK